MVTLLKDNEKIDLTHPDSPITAEEIKSSTFNLGVDKAFSPDECPLFFFQKFWSMVGQDLINLGVDFSNGGCDLERINFASIALFPKQDNPKNPNDFHPISLINSSLKILSKVLTS